MGLLVLTAGLAWALSHSVEPRLVCFAVLAPTLGLLLGGLLGGGPEDMLDGEEQRALLIVGPGARASRSAAPSGRWARPANCTKGRSPAPSSRRGAPTAASPS